jgi:hypothetical protein
MKWELEWDDPFTQYLAPFATLVGDRRTWFTLTQTVRGIISSGSLICQRIAAHAAGLSKGKKGAQRIIRMVTAQTTQRSPQLDAAHLTAQVRCQAVSQLAAARSGELWLIAHGSDLRKPHAKAMPEAMKVKSLEGRFVPGYRTLTVLGLTPQRRGILYHRLFSSKEAGFVSEGHEVQQALATLSQALTELKAQPPVSWILDSGFDDIAVWRTIWEQDEHLVCRLCHDDRLVEYAEASGSWQQGSIAQARQALRHIADAQTMLEVRKTGQPRAKRQRVTVSIFACPIRLTYESNLRRPGPGTTIRRQVWLVEVGLGDTNLEPWLLLTDWEVTSEQQALRLFQMYRQRWGVEDSKKFTKECLGWEEVQVLDLAGIRTLVALAWVAAGFLYELGITLDDAAVQLLAKLGGWEERSDRRPGKIVLTRGLRRLVEMLTTEAQLTAFYRQAGRFPPSIAAFLHGWLPHDQL